MSTTVNSTKVNGEFCVFVPVKLLQLHTAVPYDGIKSKYKPGFVKPLIP